jgi:glutamate 5-kinase
MATQLADARTLIVKVGSSLVTNEGRGLDVAAIARWAAQIAQLRALGRRCVMVSSGAIAEGLLRLGWSQRPHALNELQAAAAVGQMGLVQCYETCFRKHGIATAQVLLTHADMADRQRYLNARSTLLTLLGLGVIPVINENDTVVTDEIKVGDNDTLAALVTNLVEADALVILTDQAGLYDADPRHAPAAKLIEEAVAGEPRLEAMAGGAGSSLARGGMITKVLAAKRAARSGTLLLAQTTPLAARKQWLADHLTVSGRLALDAGAARALMRDGKSLLPIGVAAVSGDFERGAVVGCDGPDGREIARGLVNYGAAEARLIMRRPSNEIESILGYVDQPELIHRDNLVLL